MDKKKSDLILFVMAICLVIFVFNKFKNQYEFKANVTESTPTSTKVSSPSYQDEIAKPIDCNVNYAKKIQKNFKQMATWKVMDGVVIFKWGYVWDDLAPEERLKLIQGFADSDACIIGKAREIRFYRKGNLVGKADPTWGIELK